MLRRPKNDTVPLVHPMPADDGRVCRADTNCKDVFLGTSPSSFVTDAGPAVHGSSVTLHPGLLSRVGHGRLSIRVHHHLLEQLNNNLMVILVKEKMTMTKSMKRGDLPIKTSLVPVHPTIQSSSPTRMH